MIKYELIICFTDFTWITDFVEVCPEHIDSDNDVHQGYIEDYIKNRTPESKEIAFVGTYHTEDMDDESREIVWRPYPREYPVPGLKPNEAYEDVEMGKSCHPDVKEWLPTYKDTIENLIIIPYNGKD